MRTLYLLIALSVVFPAVSQPPIAGRLGIPNIFRPAFVPPSPARLLIAFIGGYVTNRFLDFNINPDGIRSCPEGWREWNNRCYFFGEIKLNWYGAEAYCRRIGGYLAQPDTEEENDVLKTWAQEEKDRLINVLGIVSPHYARWLGLRRDGGVVRKIIIDKEPTFTDFIGGSPDPDLALMCVKMDDANNFEWAVKSCPAYAFFFICERSIFFPFKFEGFA